MSSLPKSQFMAGVRAALPFTVAAFPIGTLLGVAVQKSDVVSNSAGLASSVVIFAGSAQLVAIQLFDRGAGVVAILAAVAMINARHFMYSAALSDRFRGAPRWFRYVGSYLLIDQVFALTSDQANPELSRSPQADQMAYHLGAGIPLFITWQIGTILGIMVGDIVPGSWQIEFAVPLMFAALLVLTLTDRPSALAAVVGGVVAWFGRDWPAGSGLLVGATLGVIGAALLARVLYGPAVAEPGGNGISSMARGGDDLVKEGE